MKRQTVIFAVVVFVAAAMISGLVLMQIEGESRTRVITLTSQAARIADIQGTLTAESP